MYNEELVKSGGTTHNPCIIQSSAPSYPVYTATEQDLGMHYQPVITGYARSQYRGLVSTPKYGMFSGENPQGKKEIQYNQWIYEVDSWKKHGEALGREAIIHSLKGKPIHTICHLGHNASVPFMLDKLKTVYEALTSYVVLK